MGQMVMNQPPWQARASRGVISNTAHICRDLQERRDDKNGEEVFCQELEVSGKADAFPGKGCVIVPRKPGNPSVFFRAGISG